MNTIRLSIDLDSVPYDIDLENDIWNKANKHPDGFDFSKEVISLIKWKIVDFEQPHTILVEVMWDKLRDRI